MRGNVLSLFFSWFTSYPSLTGKSRISIKVFIIGIQRQVKYMVLGALENFYATTVCGEEVYLNEMNNNEINNTLYFELHPCTGEEKKKSF